MHKHKSGLKCNILNLDTLQVLLTEVIKDCRLPQLTMSYSRVSIPV